MSEIEDLSGDGRRLVEALEGNRSQLMAFLLSFDLSREEAEDLLQDAAVIALERLQHTRIESLGGWLRGTTQFLCRSYLRKRFSREGARRRLRRRSEALPPEQEAVRDCLDLDRALSGLPARMRELLTLFAMDSSPEEIAERTGYAVGSLRQLKRRGLRKLAEHFEKGQKAA